jgi:hypothetical protein
MFLLFELQATSGRGKILNRGGRGGLAEAAKKNLFSTLLEQASLHYFHLGAIYERN